MSNFSDQRPKSIHLRGCDTALKRIEEDIRTLAIDLPKGPNKRFQAALIRETARDIARARLTLGEAIWSHEEALKEAKESEARLSKLEAGRTAEVDY